MKVDSNSRKLYRQVLKWHNTKFDKLTGIKEVNGKLKIFTPEAKEIIKLKPEMTYKQKRIINSVKKAILHLNLLSLLIVFSCGTDDIMNTGNPPVGINDSLVYSVDSLGLYGTGIKDTVISINALTLATDSLKLTFTLESNCDTLAFATGTTGQIAFTISSNLNNNFTFNGMGTGNTNMYRIRFESSTPKFLRFKNIKLSKVNPV